MGNQHIFPKRSLWGQQMLGEGELEREAFLLGTFALVCRKHGYETPVRKSTASARNLASCGSPCRSITCPPTFHSPITNSSCYTVLFARTMRNREFFLKIGPRLLTVVNCLGFKFLKFFIDVSLLQPLVHISAFQYCLLGQSRELNVLSKCLD